MRDHLKINSHTTEIISALLRWLFFFLISYLYFFTDFKVIVASRQQFTYILGFAFVYMAVTQVVLHVSDERSHIYNILTKSGIVFDYIAFVWLMYLSGGPSSPFFPIAYIISIHAALYWGVFGAVGVAIATFAAYSILLLNTGYVFLGHNLLQYIMRITFLFLIAFYGGLISSRERKHFYEKNYYQNLAIQDYLTGVYNHRHFQENLKSFVGTRIPFYLIMTDIDHFKRINDAYGHITGDDVLKTISDILVKNIPIKAGHVYRYGGEEFAILIPKHSRELIETYIQAVKNELELVQFIADQEPFTITLSYGVAASRPDDRPSDVVRRADQRLYLAKRNGRNQAVFIS